MQLNLLNNMKRFLPPLLAGLALPTAVNAEIDGEKALEPFVEYVLDVYYNGVDEYGNKIEESSREESFERRWNRARAILLKSK